MPFIHSPNLSRPSNPACHNAAENRQTKQVRCISVPLNVRRETRHWRSLTFAKDQRSKPLPFFIHWNPTPLSRNSASQDPSLSTSQSNSATPLHLPLLSSWSISSLFGQTRLESRSGYPTPAVDPNYYYRLSIDESRLFQDSSNKPSYRAPC